MTSTALFIAGHVTGLIAGAVIAYLAMRAFGAPRGTRRVMPPATRRQLERAARANRLAIAPPRWIPGASTTFHGESM